MAVRRTPAQIAASRRNIALAQIASAKARKGRRGVVASKGVRESRGVGISGLRRNTIPYARVNKRSQTVGVNAGTIIPGTNRRIVFGGYARLESRSNTTALEKAALNKIKGSRFEKAIKEVSKRITVSIPSLRKSFGGTQARLSTSRGAGPTVVVRRGRHKVSTAASSAGIKKYNKRMTAIAGSKAPKPRPARRRAARGAKIVR